ncbi:CaiB/BaiF CoA transferase family protein [Ottowia thiooxydans]|uniref:CaiB/BaiF CoA transferase family protein n=1 Tax=Ottowia thiooxydans TaxID=219182 RepID=UPI000404B25A|nr:CaiB/BaiF CoA-transferase family protein [Ottowia thiooxydans]
MRPLEGLTILDLSRVLACPFASMILAELGADVIKVEQPGSGDETRSFEPVVHGKEGDVSAYYLAFNRSKRSVTVNLRSPEGQEIIRRLAAKSDVLLENFPTGTLKRYGLDYETLKPLNDRLVYVSCTGFGMTGPYAHRKGYDTVFQAMGGIMSLTGERGGGPVKPGLPVADLTSGLWVAIAILSAINGRHNSGHGSHVDFSMFDGQVGLLSLAAARWFTLGEIPERLGTEHPGRIPSAAFECSDGNWVQITGSDQHWKPLCELLGLEAWANDPTLLKNADRLARREEVMQGLGDAIKKLSRDELCKRCDKVGVPAGPILNVEEVLSNEHVAEREMVVKYDHPHIGEFKGLRIPFRFDGLDDPETQRPPLLGEHTEGVLSDLLGLQPAEIDALRAQNAI